MQAAIIGPGRWRIVWAFDRNPLVRTSDRIKAIAVTMAVAMSLLVAPIAGTIGAAVYDARSHVYARQMHTRSSLAAIVTKTKTKTSTSPTAHPGHTIVHASWRAEGIEHADTFVHHRAVKVGDQIGIWVDSDGRRVSPPPAPAAAAMDAVRVSASIWLGVVVAATALVAPLRWWLDRVHDAHWGRDIRSLADDGGRANTQ
jgi:hypothetical protein